MVEKLLELNSELEGSAHHRSDNLLSSTTLCHGYLGRAPARLLVVEFLGMLTSYSRMELVVKEN
eukprot:73528-Pleurochrysis_carterae.AAC.1